MGVNGKNGKPIVLNTMLGILRQSAYAGYDTSKRMLEGKIDLEEKNRYSEALEHKRLDLRREIDNLEQSTANKKHPTDVLF